MKPVRLLCYMFLWASQCTTFNSIPNILIVLTDKNVARDEGHHCLLDSILWSLWKQVSKEGHGLSLEDFRFS